MKTTYEIGHINEIRVEIQWFEGRYWYWNECNMKWVPAPSNLKTQNEISLETEQHGSNCKMSTC